MVYIEEQPHRRIEKSSFLPSQTTGKNLFFFFHVKCSDFLIVQFLAQYISRFNEIVL